MWLLFVLPLVVLAFIAVALCVARMAESHQGSRVGQVVPSGAIAFTTVSAPGHFSIIRVKDAFEPETSVIWDTQIPALELIWAAGHTGLAMEALLPLYTCCAQAYPELYEGSRFESWLQFLADTKLVAVRSSRAVITAEGIEFLKCRVPANAVALA